MIAALAERRRHAAGRVGSRWRTGLRVHRRAHDRRRPARPFLARRQAAAAGTGLRPCRDDQGGPRASRGDRRPAISCRARSMAKGPRPPLRQPQTGGYYLTADDAEGLVVRPDSTIDEATPNPIGLAAQNLVRLAVLTGDDIWRERADILFDGLLPIAAESMYLMRACSTLSICGCGRSRSSPWARRRIVLPKPPWRCPSSTASWRAPRPRRSCRRGIRRGRSCSRCDRRARLRRRAMLAAGDRCRQTCRRDWHGAGAVILGWAKRSMPTLSFRCT